MGSTKERANREFPPWMKVRMPFAQGGALASTRLRNTLERSGLHTVCEEASCPNLGHCWSQGTATFLIMGSRCTRNCRFCDIAPGRPGPLDPAEPEKIAAAALDLGLRHIVITSVDRDDLPDCGSSHFAETIEAVRKLSPHATIETLIPDFKGKLDNLQRIWHSSPDIINHNIETTPSLYRAICSQSDYDVSLRVLRLSAERGFIVKSGIILGLGESMDEVHKSLEDLYISGVRMLTIGQYLQPGQEHVPVRRFVSPDEFKELGDCARKLGFSHVESGPLVRSSFHAAGSMEKVMEMGAKG